MTTIALAAPVWQIGDWLGNVVDDDGINWVVTTEEGWSSRPSPRLSDTERALADGDYLGPASYSARTITLSGTADGPDRTKVQQAKDRFLGAGIMLNEPVLLVAYERHATRQAVVRPSESWKAADHEGSGGRAFDFQAVVKAVDPRKYNVDETAIVMSLPRYPTGEGDVYLDTFTADFGTTSAGWPFPWPLPWRFGRPIGGTYTLDNVGNYTTLPTWTIQGPVSYPVIANTTTGETLTLKIVLAADQSLLVDSGSEAVLLNGVTPRQNVIDLNSLFPTLQPGPNRVIYRAGAYSASTCTVRYRDAWL